MNTYSRLDDLIRQCSRDAHTWRCCWEVVEVWRRDVLIKLARGVPGAHTMNQIEARTTELNAKLADLLEPLLLDLPRPAIPETI